MTVQAWKYIGIAVIFIIYSVGMVITGYSYAQKGRGDAIINSLKSDSKKVERAKAETRVVTKQVIKYVDRIKTVVDTTGCADVPADPIITDSMLKIYRTTARPKIN